MRPSQPSPPLWKEEMIHPQAQRFYPENTAQVLLAQASTWEHAPGEQRQPRDIYDYPLVPHIQSDPSTMTTIPSQQHLEVDQVVPNHLAYLQPSPYQYEQDGAMPEHTVLQRPGPTPVSGPRAKSQKHDSSDSHPHTSSTGSVPSVNSSEHHQASGTPYFRADNAVARDLLIPRNILVPDKIDRSGTFKQSPRYER